MGGVVIILMLFIVTLSVANTMNMAVLERIGEIGTMRALGTRRGGVLQLFILEGLILGIVGGILGARWGRQLPAPALRLVIVAVGIFAIVRLLG